ncbi:MAG TPA: hypothetical protein VI636_09420 [Candidatus Angelobacter sp.]
MYVNFPNPGDFVAQLRFEDLRKAAIAACDVFDAQPNHGSPDAKRIMDALREAATFHVNAFSIELVLRQFQSVTIMQISNALDSTSIKIETQTQTLTPEDLRQAAGLLRGYATKVEAGDPLPKGPEDSVGYLDIAQPEVGSPPCHVCGAQMAPIQFKCRSCGAHTGAS